MSVDAARLERLLDRYLDEALTPEEKTELERTLRAAPQAREMFWQQTRFHGVLREFGAEFRGRELAEERRRWRWNPATRRDGTPIRSLNGRMDEMLVFRRALSAKEVRGLSQSRPQPAAPLP